MILVGAFGFDQIVSAIDGLKEGAPRAVVRALNRGIGSARTVETRAIATDTGLKQADIRDQLQMRTASASNFVATLSGSLDRIPLANFQPYGPYPSRGKGQGVSYKLPGGKGRAPNAFLAQLASGHVGVFERVGKKRLPIRELFGPSLGHVFIKFRPDAIDRAQESFLASFDHEMSGQWGGTPVPSDPGIQAANADA